MFKGCGWRGGGGGTQCVCTRLGNTEIPLSPSAPTRPWCLMSSRYLITGEENGRIRSLEVGVEGKSMRLLPKPRMKTDQRKPGGRYKEPVLIGRPFPSIFFFMFSSSDLDPRNYSLFQHRPAVGKIAHFTFIQTMESSF